MQLPETDNLDHQHAYKRGYRLALEGKTLHSMPSTFKRDFTLRDYFQQGYNQAKEDLANSDMHGTPACLRCRFAWGFIMIIGSIATAYLIIHNYEKEQIELAQARQQPLSQQQHYTPEQLALLSEQQRQDLALIEAAQPKKLPPLSAPIKSDIIIHQAQLTTAIKDRQPVDSISDSVSRYQREVTFYSDIQNATGQTLSHRWRFNDQALATIPFKISSDRYRTWSTKKMSNAWIGQWHIEIIDNQQNVLYRHSFKYGEEN